MLNEQLTEIAAIHRLTRKPNGEFCRNATASLLSLSTRAANSATGKSSSARQVVT